MSPPHGSSLWLGAELRLEHSLPSGLAPLSPSIQHHCWDSFGSFLCGLWKAALCPRILETHFVCLAPCPHTHRAGWRALAGWRLVRFWDVLASSQHVLCFPFSCSVSNPVTQMSGLISDPVSFSPFLYCFLSYFLYCLLGHFSDFVSQMFCGIFYSTHMIRFPCSILDFFMSSCDCLWRHHLISLRKSGVLRPF